ncbi:protein ALP1-like [Gigantopelta aegis]|uniref:protein ALP1-like n=1 Tax=Gigantopelta aegis TaxID=1735272 RepID=UPI001B889E33|nr:protein ALP1-like [Gigantopelta aegis]
MDYSYLPVENKWVHVGLLRSILQAECYTPDMDYSYLPVENKWVHVGLLRTFVTFLKGQGLKEIIRGFQEMWNFPNCAGAIDATHIPIIAPKEDHADYVNRKGWYSIILQAVCDHRYCFTDICIGWPGRVHDARVFANSQLMAQAVNGNLLPSSPEWTQAVGPTDDNIDMPVVLIGDVAYPMSSWLLKPYVDRGRFTEEEQTFNYRLSKARMTIENSLGRLKGRWRRFLKRLDLDIYLIS